MKRHGSETYIVQHPRGFGGLCTNPISEQSIEATRELIDDSNRRAVERGYKAEQFLICFKQFNNWFDDNGQFVKSETLVTALEIYPATL